MLRFKIVALTIAFALAAAVASAQDADNQLVDLVVGLLREQDKDLRALGLEQVRTDVKGEAATKRFAAELPKLPVDAQVGLLRALADRGDSAARPSVLEMLKSGRDEPVRLAAVSALGALGDKADLPLLVRLLADGSQAEKAAARTSLVRLRGGDVPAAIASAIKESPPHVAVALIEILTTRRALDTTGELLAAATSDDSAVRTAAMAALAQLARPEHIAAMLQGVLKAPPGRERDAAERAVAAVCARVADTANRADPVVRAIQELDQADQVALLPALGRIGGPQALAAVEAAIADDAAKRHAGGVRGLCNWPDASVADQLIKLANSDQHADHRSMALAALIRVAPLPDGRPDAERLELVKKVMTMCTGDDQRNLLLRRASAVRTVETLRYVLPFVEKPRHAESACESIVELAHHRGLREPNKAEFHKALDKVIATSKGAVVIDRAKRYKADQTWVRPRAAKAE